MIVIQEYKHCPSGAEFVFLTVDVLSWLVGTIDNRNFSNEAKGKHLVTCALFVVSRFVACGLSRPFSGAVAIH